MSHIEAELNGRSDFVDILPSWPRGTDKFLLDFALIDADIFGNLNHSNGSTPIDLTLPASYQWSPELKWLNQNIYSFHFHVSKITYLGINVKR